MESGLVSPHESGIEALYIELRGVPLDCGMVTYDRSI